MAPDDYPYSAGNLFETPNHYMYSAFGSAAFFDSYFADRTACLALWVDREGSFISSAPRLWSAFASVAGPLPHHPSTERLFQYGSNRAEESSDRSAQDRVTEALQTGSAETAELLAALLSLHSDARQTAAPACAEATEILRRNFETKRLLFSRYEKGLRRGSGSSDRLELYSRASAIFALEYLRQLDYRLLNVLLKVNDVLSAYRSRLEAENRIYAVIGLAQELDATLSLLKHRGVM